MGDRVSKRGRPKLAVALAGLVAASTTVVFFVLHGTAGVGGYCVGGLGVASGSRCPAIGDLAYLGAAVLPGLIVAYLFVRPHRWPAAGVTWCLPLLAVLGAVRALRVAVEPAGGVNWLWLAAAPVLAVVAVLLVLRWARGAAQREGAGFGVALVLIAAVPVGLVIGVGYLAIVT